MQIPSLPPMPPTPGAVLPEVAVRSLPHLQAQASSPILQRAVDPASKSFQGTKGRSNGDRAKGGERDGRGGSVNMKV